jgi:hypothetical protein
MSYTIAFKGLGSQSIHTNYSTILEHLLKDVVAHPHIKEDRYRALETRRHIKLLLCDVLRRQLLNEPAKIMAVRTIINVLQKAKQEDDSGYPVESIVCALSELAGLLQDLGSATFLELVSSLLISVQRLISTTGVPPRNFPTPGSTLSPGCTSCSLMGLEIFRTGYAISTGTDVGSLQGRPRPAP